MDKEQEIFTLEKDCCNSCGKAEWWIGCPAGDGSRTRLGISFEEEDDAVEYLGILMSGVEAERERLRPLLNLCIEAIGRLPGHAVGDADEWSDADWARLDEAIRERDATLAALRDELGKASS